MPKPENLKDRRDRNRIKGGFERHDAYYHAAKKAGYVARSIFKLEEIDHDFKIIRAGDFVLDLGCAPGSWLQYAEKKVAQKGGKLVGIDLLPVRVSFGPHVRIIQGDIYAVVDNQLMVEQADGTPPRGFDVVLSDMAPNTTGIRGVDQDRSMLLCERALEVAQKVLRPGGRFCIKVFEGRDMPNFLKLCREMFSEVKIRRPKGTRTASMETYVIGLNKK